MRFVQPSGNDVIFDAGCGTGMFTTDFLDAGAEVTGLDISRQMLLNAQHKIRNKRFSTVQGNMTRLPFMDNTFNKTVSITALEFIEDAQTAVNELLRVTRPGGIIVLATLNSLSPWAVRRQQKTEADEGHILENAWYRSPSDLLSLTNIEGESETTVHFLKDDDPEQAENKELDGKAAKLETGAFLAIRWRKPAL